MSNTPAMIHKFETAGMGKAPFKLIGMYSIPSPSLGESNPQAYQNALKAMPRDVAVGSCDYCHTPLVHNFILLSADNKKSVVGCDCVAKVGDRGLEDAIKATRREAKREARVEARQAAYEAELDAQREANNGKTDAELRRERIAQREERIDLAMDEVVEILAPLTRGVNATNGGFARDMNAHLREVNLPALSPRMRTVIVEMAAKTLSGARKGTKAYKAKYAELEPLFAQAQARYDAIMAENPPIQ